MRSKSTDAANVFSDPVIQALKNVNSNSTCDVKWLIHTFIHLYVILEDADWQLNSPLSIMERGKLWLDFSLMNAIKDDLISFSKWEKMPLKWEKMPLSSNCNHAHNHRAQT